MTSLQLSMAIGLLLYTTKHLNYKKILIAAHGNSLRGIVKHLDNMSNDAIMALNLPTGIPFVYELDENMKPVKPMQVILD